MKKLLWLVLGAAVGYVVAKRFAETPRGKELVASIDARAKEFGDAVAASYHERQAELRAAIGKADDALRK
ncbi:hypothetical protein [Herbiconiux sp. L3-i23]|uniref:hypothetical protein n=1 Tax=Herbiconiux sp. L3-i23 TaxID=2905871 RepID=UPI00205F618F|nr:hypothetical protein [Herbiconiux sp. L3-i23]BDI22799.1 hypothetical protein L3i23_15750 [Herbiconiux sp. L3-i23]